MKTSRFLYPFFFAAYPVLFLLAINLGQFSPTDIIQPLTIVLVITAVLFVLFRYVTGDWHKAGLEVSLLILLVFSYGHIHQFLTLRDSVLSDLRILTIFYGVVLILGVWGIWRLMKNAEPTSRVLSVIAPVLFVMPIIQIAAYFLQSPGDVSVQTERQFEVIEPGSVPSPDQLPDIYYIILDGYARADMLEQLYGYDNEEFLAFLADKGFYIASESQTNYVQTLLSLSTSMNLEYINYLSDQMGAKSPNRFPLFGLVLESEVRLFLENLGYKTVSVSSGISSTEIEDADYYFYSKANDMTKFSSMLFLTTPALLFSDDIFYNVHRNKILFGMDSLKQIPEIEEPKFVFAHFLMPHPPFVFGPNGEWIRPDRIYDIKDANRFKGTREEYIEGYTHHVMYLNQMLEETITEILAKSQQPPIIILQGDHGSGLLFDQDIYEENNCFIERAAIFNAYYLPEAEDAALYESISPVNSFRIVFDAYFGTELGLLEDRFYYSNWETPYNFIPISDDMLASCIIPD